MAAIVNGLSLSKTARVRRDFLHLQRLRAAGDPACRADGAADHLGFTHDAMGDGEDGPTHQPVEQLISMRAMPGLVMLRPADANEVVEAYRYVLQLRHQPAALVLSRQPLPTFDRSKYASAAGVAQGAYVMADAPGGKPEIILIATGSEVSLAIDAHETLTGQGVRSRVVSMPSWDIFEHQPQSYRDSVLPPGVTARIAIEQGSVLGLGPLCRPGRPGYRHADLWRLRTAEGIAAQFRFRSGTGCGNRQRDAWTDLKLRSGSRISGVGAGQWQTNKII